MIDAHPMEKTRRPLSMLATGATGRQGGAVARALLDRGHVVHALTRRLDSDEARALRSRGATTVGGDFGDAASLDRAMAGMHAVFVMGTSDGSSPSAETRQGVAVINAARAARVRHVVYSSAGGADQHTGIPQWESKWRVEQHLRASYVPLTILSPTYFMDNALHEPQLSELRSGTLPRPLSEKRAVQQVAVSTVGEFAAWVFERSRHFLGQRIDLASDELSGPDEAQVLAAQLGHAVSYRASDWERLADKGEQGLYAWMATQGFHADLKALRKDYPEVDWLTYPAWVAKNRAALSLPVPLPTTGG